MLAGEHLRTGRDRIASHPCGTVAYMGKDHPITRVELAGETPLGQTDLMRLDQAFPQSEELESLVYNDARHSLFKRVWLRDDRLAGVRWVGEHPQETEWLVGLMLEHREIGTLRPYLLAPGGPVSKENTKGKIVCACQNVGALEIKRAIQAGAATLQGVQSATLAGTGCGSCIPEIKKMLGQESGFSR